MLIFTAGLDPSIGLQVSPYSCFQIRSNVAPGIMGITNAQRTLNYIRTITEFIAQPQYSNVAVAMMPVNEPYQEYAIGQLPMQSLYVCRRLPLSGH